MYMPLSKDQVSEFDRFYEVTDKELSRGELLADLVKKHLNEMSRQSSAGAVGTNTHST